MRICRHAFVLCMMLLGLACPFFGIPGDDSDSFLEPPEPFTAFYTIEEGGGQGPLLIDKQGMTFSPDGRYVYVPNRGTENSFELYGRDESNGALSILAQVRLFSISGQYVPETASIHLTPDGSFVIVQADADVFILRHHRPSGKLEPVSVLPIAVDILTVFGYQIYALHGGLVVATIDSNTGQLSAFSRALVPDEPVEFHSISITNDGHHAYATRRRPFGAVGAEVALDSFERDVNTGRIMRIDSYSNSFEFGNTSVSDDGRHLYIATTTIRGGIQSFERDNETGLLTLANAYTHSGRFNTPEVKSSLPKDVFITPWVETIDGEMHVRVFPRSSITGELGIPTQIPDGLGLPIDVLHPTKSIDISPDGRHIYLSSDNTRNWGIVSRFAPRNTLRYEGLTDIAGIPTRGLSGIVDSAITHDGSRLVVVSRSPDFSDTIAQFELKSDDAALFPTPPFLDDVDGPTGVRTPSKVAVSSEGNHVAVIGTRDGNLAASVGTDKGLYVFSHDPASGELMLSDQVDFEDPWADLFFSPDNRHLYLMNNRQTVFVASIDHDTGQLESIEDTSFFASEAISTTYCISPDGGDLYAFYYIRLQKGKTLAQLRRDKISGKIVPTQEIATFDRDTLVNGGVSVSPDGKNVYAADSTISTHVGSIWIANRNPATGSISSLRRWERANDDDPGPGIIFRFVVAPNGRHLLTLGQEALVSDDGTVSFVTRVDAFDRDPATGDLTHIDAFETFELAPRDQVGDNAFVFEAVNGPWGGTLVYVGSGQKILAFRVGVIE